VGNKNVRWHSDARIQIYTGWSKKVIACRDINNSYKIVLKPANVVHVRHSRLREQMSQVYLAEDGQLVCFYCSLYAFLEIFKKQFFLGGTVYFSNLTLL